MPSKLIVASMVRDEAHRYWRSALDAWRQFADRIVVLDDNSADETLSLALDAGAIVTKREARSAAWGKEVVARQHLFDIVTQVAEEGDYILWLDADMVPMKNPRELMQLDVDAVAMPLYDLWGRDEHGRLLYREDHFWQAHKNSRIWMIRNPKEFTPIWNYRGIHCGHLPANLQPRSVAFMGKSHALLHYGYADAQDREEKLAAYARVSHQLMPLEWQHAQSITDFWPNLVPLSGAPEWDLTRHPRPNAEPASSSKS